MLRRNILIFQTGGLGDFVLTWPFAVGLARIFAQSRIIYVTHQQKGELVKRVLRLEATDIEAGWHGLYAKGGKLPSTTQSLLQSAQAVYSFLPVDEAWHQNIERFNPQARRVVIGSKMPADFSGHHSDWIVEQLRDCPPERAAAEQILRSIADRGIGFKPTGGTEVVLHPGAGSPAKCWPVSRFVELVGALKSNGRFARFVLGEVERDRWKKKDIDALSNCCPIRFCDSLAQLLEEISTASAFIGNDSGPAHLAGMIGVPTLALFGPTDPKQWKPLGPQISVLRREPIDQITVDQCMRWSRGEV